MSAAQFAAPSWAFPFFLFLMTAEVMHRSRCVLIKRGYASLLPARATFYSDADDPALPAVKVIEPAPLGASAHTWVQRKWIPALIAAYAAAKRLGTLWTLVADDDTYVVLRNLLRVLQPYALGLLRPSSIPSGGQPW